MSDTKLLLWVAFLMFVGLAAMIGRYAIRKQEAATNCALVGGEILNMDRGGYVCVRAGTIIKDGSE